MPHGRGQVAWYELGLRRDGRITGLRARVLGDAGAYAGFGGALALGPDFHDGAGHLRHPGDRLRRGGGADQHHTDGRLPRRRAARGRGAPRADDGPGRGGAGPGPRRDPPAQPARAGALPVHARCPGSPTTSATTTVRCGRRCEIAGYDRLRAEQAARRAAGDRVQLGIGVSVYVEITAGGGGEFGAVTRARRRHRDHRRRARPAHGQGHPTAFSMLVADRLGIPMEKITFVQSDTALVPRGGGTGGSRSLQLGGSAVHAAAGQVLEQARERAADAAGGGRRRHRAHRRTASSACAGVPAATVTWVAGGGRARTITAALDFDAGRRRRSRSARTSPSSRSTPRPGGSRPCATSPSTTAAGSSTRCSSTASSTAASPRASRRRCTRRCGYDADGNPLTGDARRLRHAQRRRAASVRDVANTETPTPLNPLGAKGIGESARSARPRRCRTRSSTRWPTRRPAHRHAVHARAGVAGDPRRAGGRAADPWREPPAVFAELAVRGADTPGGRQDDLNLPASGARWTTSCAAEADCET